MAWAYNDTLPFMTTVALGAHLQYGNCLVNDASKIPPQHNNARDHVTETGNTHENKDVKTSSAVGEFWSFLEVCLCCM